MAIPSVKVPKKGHKGQNWSDWASVYKPPANRPPVNHGPIAP